MGKSSLYFSVDGTTTQRNFDRIWYFIYFLRKESRKRIRYISQFSFCPPVFWVYFDSYMYIGIFNTILLQCNKFCFISFIEIRIYIKLKVRFSLVPCLIVYISHWIGCWKTRRIFSQSFLWKGWKGVYFPEQRDVGLYWTLPGSVGHSKNKNAGYALQEQLFTIQAHWKQPITV